MHPVWPSPTRGHQVAHTTFHTSPYRRSGARLVSVRAAPSRSGPSRISPVSSTEDHDRAGELKAAAYYEDKPKVVYQKSSERQFAQQEARNWRQQVYRDPDGEVAVCLAAYVDNTVQGCLDLLKVPGQPAGSSQNGGCIGYVKNVAVDPQHRRRALGTDLLQAARQLAVDEWQASHLCAHVETDNEAAGRLYEQSGYKPIGEEVMQDILVRRGIVVSTVPGSSIGPPRADPKA